MSGLVIDSIGGNCPVQADGSVDGVPFYFRARGEHWKMSIGQNPVGVGWNEGWSRAEQWGDEPYEAGWMPVETAKKIIQGCADEYMQEQSV